MVGALTTGCFASSEIGCFWNHWVRMRLWQFNQGFAVEAVHLLPERAASALQAAVSLDVHENGLRNRVCGHPGFRLAVAFSVPKG